MLDGIDLSASGAEVYQVLLDAPATSLPELREQCAGHVVESALAELETIGLVSRLPGMPPRYTAAPPDLAVEALVRSREEQLQRTRLDISRLTDRYQAAHRGTRAQDVVEVVTTPTAILHRFEQVQWSARDQVRSFDRPPYVGNPLEGNPLETKLLAAGVRYRTVYQTDSFALPGRPELLRELTAQGEQARVGARVPVKMSIADDQLGILPLELPGMADCCVIVHASSLLDSLIALFEQVWERAVPIHADGALPDTDASPSHEDAALLGLLAAGLTDAAIARQLGTHQRTVQRRVRGLLDRLDASSRFQAGLQAVRHGWL